MNRMNLHSLLLRYKYLFLVLLLGFFSPIIYSEQIPEPTISIIIDDLGYKEKEDLLALSLPGPIAYAILQEAQKKNLPLISSTNVKSIPGKGIYGNLKTVNGIVAIGTIEWIQSKGVIWNKELDWQLKECPKDIRVRINQLK